MERPEFRHGIPVEKVQDETNKNIEIPIGGNHSEFFQMSKEQLSGNTKEKVSNIPEVQNAYDVAKKLRDEQWAREDEKQKHIEEREDNAWTRSVRDMINAGINPNLINAQPAQSGGGITNSTGIDYSMYEAEMNKNLELVKQEIEKNYQGSNKEKDRFVEIISRLIQLAGLASLKK